MRASVVCPGYVILVQGSRLQRRRSRRGGLSQCWDKGARYGDRRCPAKHILHRILQAIYYWEIQGERK